MKKYMIILILLICSYFLLISDCTDQSPEAEEKTIYEKLLVTKGDLPNPDTWSDFDIGKMVFHEARIPVAVTAFYSDLKLNSGRALEEIVYLFDSSEEAKGDYSKYYDRRIESGVFPVDGWAFFQANADENYVSCYTLGGYPYCTWVGRYGRMIIEFKTYLIPERMTLDDLNAIVKEIDRKAGEVIGEIPASQIDIMVLITPTEPVVTCSSSAISLNQLVGGAAISSYDLVEDGRLIIFQIEGVWWQYDVIGQSVKAYDPPLVTESAPSPVEEMFYQIQAEDPGSHTGLGSLSPDKTKLIYWDYSDSLIDATPTPTPTPDPDPIVSEDYENLPFDQVFLLDESNPEPILLGEIQGVIGGVHWLPSGHEALLEITGWYCPYFMWLIDSFDHSFTPLLSREQADNSLKFGVYDISKDGRKILFQIISSEGNVFVYSLDDLNSEVLPNFPHNFGAWWLPDETQILAAGPFETGENAFYIYDLDSQEIVKTVLEKEKYTHPTLVYQTTNQMIFIIRPEEGQYTIYSVCID